MSSVNCIYYENDNLKKINNNICDKITKRVREKIVELIKNGKGNELDNSWLNLILNDVPNIIKNTKIRLFYNFFNDLFENLKVKNKKLKIRIEEILLEYFFELLDYSFQGEIEEKLLSQDIKNPNNNIIKLISSPKEFIKNIIIEEYSNKSKNKFEGDKYKDLGENLDYLIKDIPNKIKEIEDNVKEIEEEYLEEKEQNEIEKKKKKLKMDWKNWKSIINLLMIEMRYNVQNIIM